MVQMWRIVGGKGNGIIVREGEDLKSAQMSDRLATGALAKEMELKGERLHFRKVAGSGPDEGWISIRVKGNEIAIRVGAVKSVGESGHWNIDMHGDPTEHMLARLWAKNVSLDRGVNGIKKDDIVASMQTVRNQLVQMPAIWTLEKNTPDIDVSAYIAPGAALIGRVRIEAHASVWFNCTVRGDNEWITIREGSNSQDNSILHCDPGLPITIGKNCLVGAQACLHGCTIGDNSIIGKGCMILDGTTIGKNCFIAAGTEVREYKTIPDNSFVTWNPTKKKLEIAQETFPVVQTTASMYVENKEQYKRDLQPCRLKFSRVIQQAGDCITEVVAEDLSPIDAAADVASDIQMLQQRLDKAPFIWSLGSRVPDIDAMAFIAPGAVVIGSVTIKANASVWFKCTVRGDNSDITIGDGSVVHDDSILQCDQESPLTIGKNCDIGHQVCLHGCTIGDNCKIGTRAIIEDNVLLGNNVIVGVAVHLEHGRTIPDNTFVRGNPATCYPLMQSQKWVVEETALSYAKKVDKFRESLKSFLPIFAEEEVVMTDVVAADVLEDIALHLQVLENRLNEPSSLWAVSLKNPRVHSSAYVAPGATIVGDVTLHANASVWFNCTIIGDNASIRIGEGTNVQDNSILHCDDGLPIQIGDNCLIGHQVCLQGCKIGDNCLIGTRTTILEGVSIGSNCLVAAGSYLGKDQKIPDDSFVIGNPAKRLALQEDRWEPLLAAASHYVQNKERFKASLKASPP